MTSRVSFLIWLSWAAMLIAIVQVIILSKILRWMQITRQTKIHSVLQPSQHDDWIAYALSYKMFNKL